MKRHTITEGAKTSAGGVVIAGSSCASINGAKIALENDPIFCKACRSSGRILCIGPRISSTWNGKQVALENDLCICGCSPPPKLIASQTVHFQTVGDPRDEEQTEAYAPSEQSSIAPAAASSKATEGYDMQFQITDQASNLPLRDWPYLVELANGTRLQGRTDSEGKTGKIAAMQAEYATLHVLEADSAPINPHWDR